MYVRRKVFSVLTDEMGEERLYSVNETLLGGYEYDEVDERMYADVNDYNKEIAGATKGALTAAGVLGAGYGTYVGGKKLINSAIYEKSIDWVKKQAENGNETARKLLKKAENGGEKAKKAVIEFAKATKEKGSGIIEKGKNAIVKSKPVVWVKNNPKLASGIAAGTAIASAAGYGAYKAHKNKKKNEEE